MKKIIVLLCILPLMQNAYAISMNQFLAICGGEAIAEEGFYWLKDDVSKNKKVELAKNIAASGLTIAGLYACIHSLFRFAAFEKAHPGLVQLLATAGALDFLYTGIRFLQKEDEMLTHVPVPDTKRTLFKTIWRLYWSCTALVGLVPLTQQLLKTCTGAMTPAVAPVLGTTTAK